MQKAKDFAAKKASQKAESYVKHRTIGAADR